MKKYIIENGVYANFTQMQKNAVKTEALLSGSNKYKDVRAICIITSDDFDIETVYAAAKEKYVAWSKGQYKMYDKYIEVTEPATVQPEVKAAEVKEEIVEETEMSAMFTAEQVAALVLAASKGTVPTTQVVTKEVVPADYESLKKELETSRKTIATWQSKYTEYKEKYEKLVAEMESAKPVVDEKTVEKTVDDIDSSLIEDDCSTTENTVLPFEGGKENCLFGDDFVFSTDYIEQIRAIRDIIGYTGVTEDRTVYTCRLNKEKKISFTNGYEFVAALTVTTRTDEKWNEVVATLTAEREGRNILSKSVRSLLKTYFAEGLSKKEIGEAMSLCE